jgi:hypothetical protein
MPWTSLSVSFPPNKLTLFISVFLIAVNVIIIVNIVTNIITWTVNFAGFIPVVFPVTLACVYVRRQLHGNSYQYDSLPDGEYIRYLVLKPGQPGDPLSCDLVTARLDQVPSYEAISYTWGSTQRTAEIYCAGRVISITTNLSNVLHRVRKTLLDRTLWADSICINQDNQQERNHQVMIMAKIYGNAGRTLICLGEHHEHGPNITSLLEEVYPDGTSQLLLSENSNPTNLLFDDPKWKSLDFILKDPWFQRVWVVQEAGLARDPIVIYGNGSFKWRALMLLMRWMMKSAPHRIGRFGGAGFKTIHQSTLTAWRPQNEVNKSSDLYDNWNFVRLLQFARYLEAYDPKDRIYGLLGSYTASLIHIIPDYSKSVQAVYLDFATQWLQCTGDISILSAVEHQQIKLNDDFPSWVPIWNHTNATTHFGLYTGYVNASKGMDLSVLKIENGTHLHLRGLIFDTVKSTVNLNWYDLHLEDPNPMSSTSEVSRLVQIWNRLADTESESADVRLDTLLSTLTCVGVFGDRRKQDKAAYALRLCQMSPSVKISNLDLLKKDAENGEADHFAYQMDRTLSGRRFFFSVNGYYGLAPDIAQAGDFCCIISGATVPFILRPTEKPYHYKLVGEIFMHNVMMGEEVQKRAKGELKGEDIILC